MDAKIKAAIKKEKAGLKATQKLLPEDRRLDRKRDKLEKEVKAKKKMKGKC